MYFKNHTLAEASEEFPRIESRIAEKQKEFHGLKKRIK